MVTPFVNWAGGIHHTHTIELISSMSEGLELESHTIFKALCSSKHADIVHVAKPSPLTRYSGPWPPRHTMPSSRIVENTDYWAGAPCSIVTSLSFSHFFVGMRQLGGLLSSLMLAPSISMVEMLKDDCNWLQCTVLWAVALSVHSVEHPFQLLNMSPIWPTHISLHHCICFYPVWLLFVCFGLDFWLHWPSIFVLVARSVSSAFCALGSFGRLLLSSVHCCHQWRLCVTEHALPFMFRAYIEWVGLKHSGQAPRKRLIRLWLGGGSWNEPRQ